MKSVMISIKPYWVFLIIAKTMGWNIDKEKTVEVRKTYPQDDEWDKVGKIYCTKDKKSFNHIPKKYQPFMKRFLGKVIGEFICDKITSFGFDTYYHMLTHRHGGYNVSLGAFSEQELYSKSCLSFADIYEYIGERYGYAWHISDLKIYDEPKALNKFYKKDFEEALSNWEDLFSIGTPKGCLVEYPPEPKEEDYILTRPPQSWCYVENIVYCKDCKHLMFSDCYAECEKAYKGIVAPYDYCDKGELK